MRSFGRFNRLAAKPEHLEAALTILADGQFHTPKEIAENSGLTQTQAGCALDELEAKGRIRVQRQETSPKVLVALVENVD